MQRPRRESVLATVLFTDIVGSSELAAELGDRRWKVLLSRHHALVRRELRRFGGKELDTAGDGFFASFDNPGNAVRCAASLVGTVQTLGIDIRTGLHLGQAEIVGRKLGGVAVHIGARTMAQAGPAEVLATSGLKDVLPPADFRFVDRGTHTLKGVPGEWRLYRLTSLDKAPAGPARPRGGGLPPGGGPGSADVAPALPPAGGGRRGPDRWSRCRHRPGRRRQPHVLHHHPQGAPRARGRPPGPADGCG